MALADILQKVALRRDDLWQRNPELKHQVEELLVAQQENLPMLIERAKTNLIAKGCHAQIANTPDEAINHILSITGQSPVVQAYSPLLKELGLTGKLREAGVHVTETHFGALAVDLLNKETAHPDFPAGNFSEEEILASLANYAGTSQKVGKEEVLKRVRQRLRPEIESAPVGISGVSAVIAEHGSLVLGEDQGHIRAVSNLPPIHIALVNPRQIVATLDDAVRYLRYQAIEKYGRDIQTYLSMISGPSRTADIEFKMVNGVHGPGELYVVFLA